MTGPNFVYTGSELNALSGAQNYYRWLIRRFTPFLGANVVEVGAGIGTFSEYLLGVATVESLVAIEPAGNTFPILRERLATRSNVEVIKGYLKDFERKSVADSLVAVNVLEHVKDDEDFLRRALDIVRPGGTLLLFVPAIPAIFGSLDKAFEHFRRYTRPRLRSIIEIAGWTIERIDYMNFPGILPWFIAGRALGRTSISSRAAIAYDRFVIPFAQAMEDRIQMPIGQSLLAVGRRPVA